MSRPPGSPERLRLGYACTWWSPRAATWSYSSNRLRDALDEHADVVDIETQRALPVRAVEVAAARALRTPWQYFRLERAFVDLAARRGVRRQAPQAVIEVADVDTPLSVPRFPYQDMSFALGLASRGRGGEQVNLLPASPSRLAALAARGTERLRTATGVFAMSQWLADDVIARGVAAERVHVVHAGLNSPPSTVRDPHRPVTGRVLFVGVDFVRKGGDAVVDAVRELRGRGAEVSLTVVGPARWPLDTAPPPWLDFRGRISSQELGPLWAEHDVFALPSRFEAYGIAFVEALAAGLPCVGYGAYAMPELVAHGRTGLLVPDVRGDAVAEAIESILNEPAYLTRVAQARAATLARHDWSTVARRMVDVVTAALD